MNKHFSEEDIQIQVWEKGDQHHSSSGICKLKPELDTTSCLLA